MVIGFHIIQTYTYVIYRNVWRSINRAAGKGRDNSMAAKATGNAGTNAHATNQV